MTDLMLNRGEWIGVTAGALSLAVGRGGEKGDLSPFRAPLKEKSCAPLFVCFLLPRLLNSFPISEDGVCHANKTTHDLSLRGAASLPRFSINS